MGRSRYSKVKEVLKDVVGKKYHKNKIWQRIMVMVGSDERTIRDCMNLMISLGMIAEVEQDYYKVLKCTADID